MEQKRNAVCTCGSGKKYKGCCAVRRPASMRLGMLALGVFTLAAVWVLGGMVLRLGQGEVAAVAGGDQPVGPTPPGKVWSAEHGHWHDDSAPGLPPGGEAPEGKVWSAEHGHWHDAPATEQAAPEGKVWSDEHGHWHDAPGGTAAPAELPQIPEEAVSVVDEP